jgi:hypothetical protein
VYLLTLLNSKMLSVPQPKMLPVLLHTAFEDCDNDDECGDGLMCLQRDAGDPVSDSCTASDFGMSADICVLMSGVTLPEGGSTIEPTAMDSTMEATVMPTVLATSVFTTSMQELGGSTVEPTTMDSTMAATVMPTVLATSVFTTSMQELGGSTVEPTTMDSTMAATVMPTVLATSVFTTSMEELPLLNTIGNDGNFDVYPLPICSGDCDTAEDCEGDLVCFQRAMDEPVPGCRGKKIQNFGLVITVFLVVPQ